MKIEEEKLEWIASKSLIDCHVEGVDSIMFDDTPGKRVRVFIANENHQLWRNHPDTPDDLSAALHPHHCELILSPIFGEIGNVIGHPYVDGAKEGHTFRAWIYQSQISTGVGVFVDGGFFKALTLCVLDLTEPLLMPASVIHTIYVPRGTSAAWFVYEGEDDPLYKPLAYSNSDLDKLDFSRLYKPMSVEYLRRKLDELPVERLSLVAV